MNLLISKKEVCMNIKTVLSIVVFYSCAMFLNGAVIEIKNEKEALADIGQMQAAFMYNNPTKTIIDKVKTVADLRTALISRLNYISISRRKAVVEYITKMSHGDRDITKALKALDDQYYALLEQINKINSGITTQEKFTEQVFNKFPSILIGLNNAKAQLDKAWMTTYVNDKKSARRVLDELFLTVIRAVNETRFVLHEKKGLFGQVQKMSDKDRENALSRLSGYYQSKDSRFPPLRKNSNFYLILGFKDEVPSFDKMMQKADETITYWKTRDFDKKEKREFVNDVIMLIEEARDAAWAVAVPSSEEGAPPVYSEEALPVYTQR